MSQRSFDFKTGEVLLVNKPLKWTSFDVVNKLRYYIRKNIGEKNIKVGHAGTLDPLADGLLIICTGKKTKEIDTYQGQEKLYSGTITLGATTPSFDLETTINETFPTNHLTNEMIENMASKMIGEQDQFPPIFSAKKIDGQRAYDRARKGQDVELKSKKITISKFQITNISLPNVNFIITCSKGTYIRSIANDFGKSLNTGGHLTALRREQIGDFKLSDAYEVEELIDLILPKNQASV